MNNYSVPWIFIPDPGSPVNAKIRQRIASVGSRPRQRCQLTPRAGQERVRELEAEHFGELGRSRTCTLRIQSPGLAASGSRLKSSCLC